MEFEYAGIMIVPLITGLIQLLKPVIKNKHILPFISLILGLASGIVLFSDGDIKTGVVIGLYQGMAAVGTFEIVKNTSEDLQQL